MEIAVVGDEDTVIGFKLAGISHASIYDAENAESTVEQYREASIVIVTEKVAKDLEEKGLLERFEGAIAEIPDKGGSSGEALRNIGRLLEEAVGVKLKGD